MSDESIKLPSPDELAIISYPHPTLRHKAKPVRRVDKRLKAIVERMFELMYEHKGVGLAATQVDLPLRLFVMNPKGDPNEGEARVVINPVLSKPKTPEEAEEGCLSIPQLFGNVVRSKKIRLNAFDLSGNEIDQVFSGFEARVIQHETDHLDGVLFIDRMKEGAVEEFRGELENLTSEFESQQRTGGILSDEDLTAQRAAWEAAYA